jgi:AAA+ ATPase superfamily predicted ATPase
VYGEIVPVSAFVDREEELERLIRDLRAGQKIFLISPRRYGKSSLVRQALRAAARGGTLTVEVQVSSYSSYVAFLEGYARALVSVEARLDQARSWLRDMLSAVRPEVRVEPAASGKGQLALSFPAARSDRDISRLAQEVFAMPARIAETRRRPMAIALDEFQAIASFNGGSVEHALRAAVQQQRQVGYVFSGSEPSLMERMLGKSRPFYKAGPVMRLDRIPADRFAEFLDARFKATGIKPAPGLGAAIVELAGNLPYDVQRLAHEVWDDVRSVGGRTAGEEDLHATLKRLLGEHETLF